MPAELNSHPSSADLQSFAHGRLPAKEMAEVEQHVAECDSCCKVLEGVPEDTLVQMAREAATEAFRAGETAAPRNEAAKNTVPPELLDHPRYKTLGLVGLGGMGAVYKAEHRLMERLVALKVISRSFTSNPQAVERFRREVKAAARLSHPNIVTAHDAEQAGDLHFLVMEFVDGVSLDRLVAKQGTPTVSQTCGLMRQAALGLQHAHEKGMVHRDVKPANLMVTKKGQLKILDFGLARLAREIVATESQAAHQGNEPLSGATAAGMILGTPDYIAPEQAADSRQADVRADIYSLGCTFYFLLTGKPPFPSGTVMQKLAAHMHETPPRVDLNRSDIPKEVAGIVQRMMAKKPEDRYQTPGEAAKDLQAALKGTPEVPKLEPLKPAEDLFAGIDLAALPPGPATPPASLMQPPPPTSPSGGDFSDWFSENRKLVTIIGAAVCSILLIALCAWGAGKFLGGNRSGGLANQGNPAIAPQHASLPSQSRPRILFCVPHYGVWEPDFHNVMRTLSSRATVKVASTVGGPCQRFQSGGQSEIQAELVIGGNPPILTKDFDAIIFAGADTAEFQTESTANLIRQFAATGKLVTAICKGQEVLAFHGYFDGGPRVAESQYLQVQYDDHKCSAIKQPAVRDGNLITGQDDKAGPAFASLLLETLRENR